MKFISNVFLMLGLGLAISVAYFLGHALETHEPRFFSLAIIDLVLAIIMFTLAIRIGRKAYPPEQAH